MASDHVRADMIETSEFPEIVKEYEVQGVPHTVINDFYSFIGPQPELETVYEILRALGKEAPPIQIKDQDLSEVGEHSHDHSHHMHHEPEGDDGPGKLDN
jgi:hypothetical protein